MKTIRNGVFETNSSSTHCITIVDEDDFEKFEKCEMLLDYETLVPTEDVYKDVMEQLSEWEEYMTDEYRNTYKDSLTLEQFKEVLKKFSDNDLDYGYREDAREEIDDDFTAVKAALSEDVTTLKCMGGECYETFVDRHTTKHGDKVVAFGYYGYAG